MLINRIHFFLCNSNVVFCLTSTCSPFENRNAIFVPPKNLQLWNYKEFTLTQKKRDERMSLNAYFTLESIRFFIVSMLIVCKTANFIEFADVYILMTWPLVRIIKKSFGFYHRSYISFAGYCLTFVVDCRQAARMQCGALTLIH